MSKINTDEIDQNDFKTFEMFVGMSFAGIRDDIFDKAVCGESGIMYLEYEDESIKDAYEAFTTCVDEILCSGLVSGGVGMGLSSVKSDGFDEALQEALDKYAPSGRDPVKQMVVDAEFETPDFEEVPPVPATPPERPHSQTTRALTRHVAPGMPHNLLVQVNDPVTAGGASYSYDIVLPDGTPFPFEFQSQEPELGINGITMEALLAICIDRLECFQKGPYPCRENALALTKIEEGLLWLHRRTERLAAGLDE